MLTNLCLATCSPGGKERRSWNAASAVAGGESVRVLPTLEPESVDVHALYPSDRSLSAKVHVFIDALIVHLKARPASDTST